MSFNHATPNRECARLRPLLPLQAHDLLAPEDAERLRLHVATCPRCQAELAAYARLDAALRRAVASAPTPPFLTEEIMDRIESPIASAPPPSAPTPPTGAPHHRPRRLVAAFGAVAALVIVALFAHMLLAARGGTTTPNGTLLGLPEPTATITYTSSQFAASGVVGGMNLNPTPASERDPRAVFANNLKLSMCLTQPIGAVSVTWLTTSPTFGLALVEANCGRGTHAVAQIALTSRLDGLACHQWSVSGTIENRPDEALPLPSSDKGIPTWLPLPQRSYIAQSVVAPSGALVEQLYTDWLYDDQTYATGRYVGHAYESPSATTITLAGHTGWISTDGGYTTVTIPLPGGQTFFFGGTASAATIQSLASVTLAHLDDLFPNIGTPTPDPSFSC